MSTSVFRPLAREGQADEQVMFSTTLEVEKQLQQVIKQLYEKVSWIIYRWSAEANEQATTSVIV